MIPANIERDLYTTLKLPVTPYWIEVPIRDPVDRTGLKMKRIPLLLPHEMYHYLFESWLGIVMRFMFLCWWNLQKFNSRYWGDVAAKDSGKLTLNPAEIAKFWEHTTKTGFLNKDHPGKWGANVCGLYGDDARFTKSGEKLLAIVWNCILQETARV